MDNRPIGVFDSGLGGLSVVRRLREQLPGESIVYFGDTARVPYGTKSRETVVRFALDDARFLLRFDPKLIVVACNTASAVALPTLGEALDVPVVGVVEAGARAAVEHAEGGPVGVIGTEATIRSGAYAAAIRRLAPELEVLARACPLLVPLVEEGRTPDDPIVRLAVEEYLSPLREAGVRALVLACTHYPLLAPAIRAALGPRAYVVDCGQQTARDVARILRHAHALSGSPARASMRCFVSDRPQRFAELAARFLGEPFVDVQRVPLEELCDESAPAEL